MNFRPLLLALVAAAPAALVAQSPAPASPATMPTVIVHGGAAGESLTVPSYEQKKEELALVPGGTAIVDGEKLREGRATTLKDALDFAPGVYVQPRFGAEEARISIRGSGLQRTFHGRGLKLLQDGVPLNLADGGFDFQAVDPLTARYIEVYRGANALQYGGTTLGGAVNFVSYNGKDDPGYGFRGEFGSWETWRAQLYGAGVEGPLDYYVSVSTANTEGYRDHSRQENLRVFGNVGYTFSENLETRFYFTYAHTDSELPGDLTLQQLRDNPRQAARSPVKIFDYVDSNWKRDFDLYRIANRTTWTNGDDRFTVSSFYAYKELDHPILFVIDQQSHDFGVDLRYDGNSELFGLRDAHTIGFSAVFGFTDDQRYDNVFGNRGFQFADVSQFATNLDWYLQERLYLTDTFALVLGGQISYARRENDDNFGDRPGFVDSSDTQDWWGYSPQIGVLWDVQPGAQIFANVSRSFEPPSFGELTAPATGGFGLVDLEAQTATTIEVGTRGDLGRVRWDLAYYYSWIQDELIQQTVSPGLTQTLNAGDTIHQGVELGFELDIIKGIFARGGSAPVAPISAKGSKAVQPVTELPKDRITLRQNYLFNDFRFDGNREFNDNEIAGIPRHYFRTELVYEHPCGFYMGPNLEWVPQGYFVDHANTLETDSYALLGFRIGYRQEKGFSCYVEARNLTDEHYAATTSVTGLAGPFSSNL
ncbi:hypothetical protein AYO49_05100, partial [Verrucomicrobiaceae bacterium SCGC AG-212-N21]